MGKKLEFSVESRAIMTLITEIRTVEFGGLDLQPKYQRNYIWKNDFKDKLLYSIIKSYPIGSIILRKLNVPNEKGAMSEIVDGQQRLTTIYDFVEGKYEITSEFSRKIIEEIQDFYGDKLGSEFEKLKKKLQNKGNIRLRYADLPSVVRAIFESFNISVTKISEATEFDITEYFQFLQNQERLRAGEILTSLSDSKMEKYLAQIEDRDAFCHMIGFDNKRKEFDKLFYNIIGLIDRKISLGVPDSIIKKYVISTDELTEGKEDVEDLLFQINFITAEFKNRVILHNIKKRFVKFFMLLIGFGLIDFTVDTEYKLGTLQKLDDKFSVFFSTKPGIEKEEFEGYADEVIDELRSIALVSKGAQTLERVRNRMEILAYYVNHGQEKEKPSGIPME